MLIEVPGKDPRPCVDSGKLNAITKDEVYPLPNIEERVELVSKARFILPRDRDVDEDNSWRGQDETLYLSELVAGKWKLKLQQCTLHTDSGELGVGFP